MSSAEKCNVCGEPNTKAHAAWAELCVLMRRPTVPVVEAHETTPVTLMREYVSQNQPVVIRGMLGAWPATRLWTAEYMAEAMADTPVTVAFTPNGRADAGTRVPAEKVTTTVEGEAVCPEAWAPQPEDDAHAPVQGPSKGTEYLEPMVAADDARPSVPMMVAAHERQLPLRDLFPLLPRDEGREQGPDALPVAYAQFQNSSFTKEYQALKEDVGDNVVALGEALFGGKPEAENMWIGGTASVSTMHQDWFENLYAVVAGTKVFTLIPSWEAPAVPKRVYRSATYTYPGSEDNEDSSAERAPLPARAEGFAVSADEEENEADWVPWVSVDPTDKAQACKECPRFAHLRPLRVEVEAGDVLYLPAMWYHRVAQVGDAEGKVVAVNYWFDMQFSSPAAGLRQFIVDGLATEGQGDVAAPQDGSTCC